MGIRKVSMPKKVSPPTKYPSLLALKMLLWKNWKTKSRRPISTTIEVLLPTLFFYVLVYARSKTLPFVTEMCTRPLPDDGSRSAGSCEWEAFSPVSLSDEMKKNCKKGWYVGYAPEAASTLVAAAVTAAGASDRKFSATTMGFADEEALLEGFHMTQGVLGQEGCRVGIVFSDFNVTNNVHYALRFEATPGGYQKNTEHDKDEIAGVEQFLPGATWLTDKAFPFFSALGARNDMELLAPQRPNGYGNAPGYYKFGYLMWQHALNTAILGSVGADTTAYEAIQLNRMPYPPYKEDYFVHAVQFGLPLLLMLALLYTALLVASSVVREKQHGLKIALEMVGVPNWIHWVGWFITHGAVLLFAISPIGIAVSRGHALEHVGSGAFFFFLFAYSLASISFCFFVSTFFHKASSAAAGSGICWFLSYSPYFFVFPRYVETPASLKVVLSFLPNTAMALGSNIIALREATGEGITLANWSERMVEDDPFTFETVIGMLCFDTVLYLALAMYVEKLNPGAYGIPRPWYFPILPLLPYIRGGQGGAATPARRAAADDKTPLLGGKRADRGDGLSPAGSISPSRTVYNPSFLACSQDGPDDCSRFEPDPKGMRVGIQIEGLRREFGPRVAVANTSLNVYQGQITSLLGHNGAGKTTTLQLITGMIPATAGSIRVDGHDVNTDTLAAQRAVTVCHQHDVLFPSLTLREHMWLFARLKGVPEEVANSRVAEMIEELGLTGHADAIATTLSGGQKRRLGVGMALVGQSRVVILDEPTSGMDPASRRATWDVLKKHCADRTILLSTHFMDEADVLSDRIAIMAHGVVECCGNPLFLKEQYGGGYKLTLLKESSFDENRVLGLVAHVGGLPDVTLHSSIGAEVTVAIPLEAAESLPDILDQLSHAKAELGVASIGCSVTSMEDVFVASGKRAALRVEALAAPPPTVVSRWAWLTGGDSQPSKPAPCGDVGREAMHSIFACATIPELDELGLLIKERTEEGIFTRAEIARLRDAFTERKRTLRFGNARVTGRQHYWDQFKALSRKRWNSTKRNSQQLAVQLLPPILFTLLALIVVIMAPGTRDLPARSLSDVAANYGDNHVYVNASVTTDDDDGALSNITTIIASQLRAQSPHQQVGELPEYGNVSEFVLAAASGSPYRTSTFNRRTPFVFEEVDGVLTAWFNGQAYHTVAQAPMIVASAVYASVMGESATITSENYPLPRTADEKAKEQTLDKVGFALSFAIMFGLAPLASSVVIFVVHEAATNSKHLQFVSSVNPIMYWASTFVHDLGVYCIGAFGSILLFPIFGFEAFLEDRFGVVVLLYLLYGMAIIPLMYLISFICTDPSTAFIRLTILNVVTGLGALTVISVLDVADPESAESWRATASLLPNYNLAQALSDVYSNYQLQQVVAVPCRMLGISLNDCCEQIEQELLDLDIDFPIQCTSHYLRMKDPGVGRFAQTLFFQFFLWSALVLAVEYIMVWKSLLMKLASRGYGMAIGEEARQAFYGTEDSDVARERSNIAALAEVHFGSAMRAYHRREDAFSNSVVLHNLTRVYRTGTLGLQGSRLAVNDLSFRVSAGECFGLLGVNGAGKSTTFKMLTGDIGVTSGNAYIDGLAITQHMREIHKVVGYCPQYDAVPELLTGREVLWLYCHLRGLPETVAESTVNRLLFTLQLEEYGDVLTKHYSGGTRRKLSTAVALVGDPAVVFLDEPTTGMDPVARHELGQTLVGLRSTGTSVVLTSHSMEEAEALCSRVGVMVGGQLACIGSSQHLKEKFGKYYTIVARFQPEAIHTVLECLETIIPEFMLMEQQECMVRLQLEYGKKEPLTGFPINVSYLVQEMQQLKTDGILDAYSVSEANLEDIFLDLVARDGNPEDPTPTQQGIAMYI